MKLKIGDKAPEFNLPNQDGKMISLSSLLDNEVLIYFYPGDFTPGCTAQACNFRDHYSEYEQRGITIIGISMNSQESHKKFKQKFTLPFDVLSDESGEVTEKYDSLFRLKLFGIDLLKFSKRNSFIINKKGNISKIFENVDPFAQKY
jgi:peroxiredoxin Q/BCP